MRKNVSNFCLFFYLLDVSLIAKCIIGMFKGKPVPAAQPQLMTGGIMRSYQVEGMEWIKVGSYYHDNHTLPR